MGFNLEKLKKKIFNTTNASIYKPKSSFSQDGEDMILASFFEDHRHNYTGYYVDVGAHDPYRFSNTQFFYEKGWRGINIEPTPTLIDAFRKHRKQDINLNIGVANEQSFMTFYCFDEPALNSFSKSLSDDRDKNTSYSITNELSIPVDKLSHILDLNLPPGQKIDFLSIDVEGLDMEVLKSNDWTRYRPDYILVEDIIPFSQITSSDVYQYLIEQNYSLVAKTTRTLFFKVV